MVFLTGPHTISSLAREGGSTARKARATWSAGGWLAAALAVALAAGNAGAQTASELENRLKTEFIERFTQFIDWPAAGGSGGDEPFVLGIYGRTSLARSLRELTRRQPIKGRPARLVQLESAEEAAECDVVFIAESEPDELAEILAATGGRAILTVSDTPGFARRGVLINFVREGDRLRFEVNTAAVERSGLRFSSRLLRLATLIGPEPPP